MSEARRWLYGRLCEAVVELAAAPARNVREDSIERSSTVLRAVQPKVQKRAQEAAALRLAGSHDVVDAACRGVRVGVARKEGRQVANREEPDARHRATPSAVDQVVDAARLEAVAEPDVFWIRDYGVAICSREAPLVPPELDGLVPEAIPGEQLRLGIVDVRRGDPLVHTERADVLIREVDRCAWGVELKPELKPVRNGSACGVHDDRHVQPHARRVARNVPLPTAPTDRPAFAEQEAIPGVDLGSGLERPGAAIEHARRCPSAPVRYLEQERALSAQRVGRLQEDGISAKVNKAVPAALRLGEIDDSAVLRMDRVDCVVDDGVDLLVRSHRTKVGAPVVRLAREYLKASYRHSSGPSCWASIPRDGSEVSWRRHAAS